MRLVRGIPALALLLAGARGASAEPPSPPPRGTAAVELRVHRGDTEQDEQPHYGFYPSIVVGAGVAVPGRNLEIVASIAAAKVSAVWENIGGVSNGLLAARTRLGGPAWSAVVAAGVAFPLEYSIPTAECYMPDQGPGDSMVLSYGGNPACWDRSAYRRAALHRGGWDIWMWAPDWVTAVGTGRIEGRGARPGIHYAVDAGLGGAMSVTDAHDGDGPALIGQVAPEGGYWVTPTVLVGVRGVGAGVVLDDTSPVLVSVEPFAEYAHPGDVVRVRLGLMMPLADLRNEEVSPGLGGYKISEHKALGVSFAASY